MQNIQLVLHPRLQTLLGVETGLPSAPPPTIMQVRQECHVKNAAASPKQPNDQMTLVFGQSRMNPSVTPCP